MAGVNDQPTPIGRVLGPLDAARQVSALIETAPEEEKADLVRAMRQADADAGTEERPVMHRAEIDAHLDRVVPRRFRQAATLTSYKPKNDAQRAALESVQEWVERVRQRKGGMLALVGSTGTGKSHLLYAAARALAPWVLGRIGLYVRPWYLLADELRYGRRTEGVYAGRAAAEPYEVRQELWNSGLVLLDEVRPTAGTGFDDTELAKFACHAWDNDVPVLITTNVSPLEQVMGPAAASRFVEVQIVGPDGRKGGR